MINQYGPMQINNPTQVQASHLIDQMPLELHQNESLYTTAQDNIYQQKLTKKQDWMR
jgi:hypothetical protein